MVGRSDLSILTVVRSDVIVGELRMGKEGGARECYI